MAHRNKNTENAVNKWKSPDTNVLGPTDPPGNGNGATVTLSNPIHESERSEKGLLTVKTTVKGKGEINKPSKQAKERFRNLSAGEQKKVTDKYLADKKSVESSKIISQVPTRGAMEIKTGPNIKDVKLKTPTPGSISGPPPDESTTRKTKLKSNKYKSKLKSVKKQRTRGSGLASTCTSNSCPQFENKGLSSMFSGNKKSKKGKRGRNKTSYRQHKR